jgi:predicted amidohydrolase YtcJ
MSMVRCEGCAGGDEFLRRLARACAEREPGEWLLAGGARVQAWREPEWPDLARLDEVTADRPACVWSFDYHALLLNSAAMRALGFGEGMPDPAHGRIVRDELARPTGLMLESAAKLAWSRIPAPGPELRRQHVLAALHDLAGHGFVEVHDLLSPPWLGPLLAQLEREGRLGTRVWLYPALAELDDAVAAREAWESERVVLAGAKLFADGTLNSRTAWMLEPYADPLPGLDRGQAMLTREELGRAMRRVWGRGLGLAVHAIGDAAVRAVLDAFEEGEGTTAPRHKGAKGPILRIEHAEIIDEADVPRFGRLGVVASVQPCHLLADVEALHRHLPHRLDRVLPLRDLIDRGCAPGELLWFGSDTPIVGPAPGDSIRAAVHRRREGAAAPEAISLQQAVSEAEAWAAFNRPYSATSS